MKGSQSNKNSKKDIVLKHSPTFRFVFLKTVVLDARYAPIIHTTWSPSSRIIVNYQIFGKQFWHFQVAFFWGILIKHPLKYGCNSVWRTQIWRKELIALHVFWDYLHQESTNVKATRSIILEGRHVPPITANVWR